MLDISLDNERIEAHRNQEKCRWQMAMIDQALNDERMACRHYQASAQNRQERIGELLREKFALLLTKRRRDHQLQ